MAEQKRYKDVPKERFLGGLLPRTDLHRTKRLGT